MASVKVQKPAGASSDKVAVNERVKGCIFKMMVDGSDVYNSELQVTDGKFQDLTSNSFQASNNQPKIDMVQECGEQPVELTVAKARISDVGSGSSGSRGGDSGGSGGSGGSSGDDEKGDDKEGGSGGSGSGSGDSDSGSGSDDSKSGSGDGSGSGSGDGDGGDSGSGSDSGSGDSGSGDSGSGDSGSGSGDDKGGSATTPANTGSHGAIINMALVYALPLVLAALF